MCYKCYYSNCSESKNIQVVHLCHLQGEALLSEFSKEKTCQISEHRFEIFAQICVFSFKLESISYPSLSQMIFLSFRIQIFCHSFWCEVLLGHRCYRFLYCKGKTCTESKSLQLWRENKIYWPKGIF